ncbi:hypothetical protein N7540_005598 [Penicillium herquei]|nr:hypothetical protein N7540_005598 [Penicillium herquei]
MIAYEAATSLRKPLQNHGTGRVSVCADDDSKQYQIPLQLDFFRNDKFTGRSDVLERIHESLAGQKENKQPNVVVLHGIGGIGKTELAVEYTHLHQESYSSIFWVDCSTEIQRTVASYKLQVKLGLKRLVDEKGLNPVLDERNLDVVEAIRDWFSEALNKEWLLIFDNLNDLEILDIMDYIPRAAWGSIIITSRQREFLSYGITIGISEMSSEEGLSLLAKTARFGRDLKPDDQQLALKLLHSLGYFPLAIEQAGAYLSQRISEDPESYHRALANYLDSYERNAKMLLQYKRLSVIGSRRNDSALTTWEVSFNAIKQESPEASYLLQLCGFLANSDIFEEMFSLGRKLPANDTTFQESVSKLASYSLQRLAHEVVQLVARSLRLKGEEEYRNYLPFEQRILPHLDQAVNNMQRFLSSPTTEVIIRPPLNSIERSPLSTLYDIAEGWSLWGWGAVSDISISCRLYLLSDVESISENWELAYRLGHIYRNQGLHSSAEMIYGWAFTEASTQLHGEHPKALEIAGDLAWAIILQEKYDDASDWYSWLLASRGKVLGKGHPATLGALKGLATISRCRGNYDKALPLYFEALAGRQKRLGQNDILALNVMVNIAEVFSAQGEYEEALRWYERALLGGARDAWRETSEDTGDSRKYWRHPPAPGKAILGEMHQSTLKMIHNIGVLYEEKGVYNEALMWYERAVSRQQKILGETHKDTLWTIYHIGIVYQALRKYDDAWRWYERALTGAQETYGEKHEDTLQMIHSIGLLLHQQGKYKEAWSWYKRALAGRQEIFGDEHSETLQTIHNIGVLFEDQGKYKEALKWYWRALDGREKILGEIDEDTMWTIRNIGDVFQALGKYKEAGRWYKRALPGQQEIFGERHEFTLLTIQNIGLAFQRQVWESRGH